ncbi:MAG: hydantoinase B/oxoprolinase family protein [Burkholderiaceae bacterium]
MADYDGSSPGVDIGVNVGFNYAVTYTTYGAKCTISPDIPDNHGNFQALVTKAPKGIILNAKSRAAVTGRHKVGHFLPSAIMGALSGLLPEHVLAPSADSLWNIHISGFDARNGAPFGFTWFSAGGTGALNRQAACPPPPTAAAWPVYADSEWPAHAGS